MHPALRPRWSASARAGVALATTALALTGVTSLGPAVQALDPAATVEVGGAVMNARSYTVTELRALPQATVTATTGGDEHAFRGPSLEALVTAAAPTLPTGSNTNLRVTLALTGVAGRTVTLALGELNASFGNHAAVLALTRDGVDLTAPGPELVVGGDADDSRVLGRVSRVAVSVQSPTPTPPTSPGAVSVRGAGRTTSLSAADLAALPAPTRTVTYSQGSTPNTRTETGPLIDTVLRRAGYVPEQVAWVAAVASTDGYVATITPTRRSAAGCCSSRPPRRTPASPPPRHRDWSWTATSAAAGTSPTCPTSSSSATRARRAATPRQDPRDQSVRQAAPADRAPPARPVPRAVPVPPGPAVSVDPEDAPDATPGCTATRAGRRAGGG